MKLFLCLLLLVMSACSSNSNKVERIGDKHLKKKDAPVFLVKATPTGKNIDDVEYFVKRTASTVTYELKYEVDDREVSQTYSDKGILLEREEDIAFSSIKKEAADKIRAYLKKRLEDYKIHETELRTTGEGTPLIDVEVTHDGGETGFTEFSFTPEGDYVSEEIEHMTSIETLN